MTRLTFLTPPYGLTETDFDFDQVDGVEGLHALRAVDQEARLYLLDLEHHLPSYRPSLPGVDLDGLGTDAPRLYAVVNPSGPVTTVNLVAPILVSPDGRARQTILDRGDWPMRAPLAELLAG